MHVSKPRQRYEKPAQRTKPQQDKPVHVTKPRHRRTTKPAQKTKPQQDKPTHVTKPWQTKEKPVAHQQHRTESEEPSIASNEAPKDGFMIPNRVGQIRSWYAKVNSAGQRQQLFFATVRVNGLLVDALVDTGSTVSLLRWDQYSRMAQRPPLITEVVQISTMGQGSLQVLGTFESSWKCGSTTGPVTAVVVKDMPFQAVLGIPALQALDALVDVKREILFLRGHKSVRMHRECGAQHDVNHVFIDHDVVVPARTASFQVTGKASITRKSHDLLAEPLELGVSRVAAERVLITNPRAKTRRKSGIHLVNVFVCNFSDEERLLKAGTELATLHSVPELPISRKGGHRTTPAVVKFDGHEIEALDLLTNTALEPHELEVLIAWLRTKAHMFLTSKSLPRPAKVPNFHINLKEGTGPVRAFYGRKAMKEHELIDGEVDKLLDADMVRPSQSMFNAPVLLVKKANGSLRFCIDYRRLNDITIKDGYRLPRIDDALDLMAHSNYFTSLDFATGYFQVPLAETDKEKTAFATRKGIFEWNVMPMGLCNAPATFQRIMDVVLSGLTWGACLCYIDDIIIFSETFPEHLEHLKEVFARLESVNLQLRAEKCDFAKRELLYLGHILSREGVRTNPGLISSVRDCVPPTNRSEVRSFLGLTNYYRRFVRKYASIVHPIQRLTREDVHWDWHSDCARAFEVIKGKLCAAPILAYPDFRKSFKLEIDASGWGLGAVLSQKGDDRFDHVIGYWSRSVPRRKAPYTSTEKECMALHHAIKHYRPYLWGKHFEVVTDHNALKWLMNLRHPTPKLQRWALDLSEFDFTITHRAGTQNSNADALSRAPLVGSTNAAYAFLAEMPVTQMANLQRRDPQMGPYRDWLENRRLPLDRTEARHVLFQAEKLYVDNDVLFRHHEPGTPGTVLATQQQLCLPTSERTEVMRECHDSLSGGHLGFNKTYLKLRSRFWWPRQYTEVLQWVLSCPSCQTRGGSRRKLQGLMVPQRYGYPWEQLGIDFLGPLKTTKNGNRYILVMTDAFTKWVEIAATPGQGFEGVAKVLIEQVICRFGCPRKLISDRGGNFLSKLAYEVYRVLQIKKISTSSYHPQTNGLTERFNSTMCQMLSHFVNQGHDDWDDYLPFMAMAYNSSTHDASKYPPSYILYGRDITLPCDISLGTQRDRPQTTFAYTQDMRGRMQEVRDIVRINLEKAGQKNAARYNLRRRSNPFKVGDKVWMSIPRTPKGQSRKFRHSWYGPYRIDSIRGPSTILRDMEGKVRPTQVHVQFLKPHHDWEDPNENPEEYIPWAERDSELPDQEDENGVPRAPIGRPTTLPMEEVELRFDLSDSDSDSETDEGEELLLPPRRHQQPQPHQGQLDEPEYGELPEKWRRYDDGEEATPSEHERHLEEPLQAILVGEALPAIIVADAAPLQTLQRETPPELGSIPSSRTV